jgi:hypothetical protein
VTDKIVRELLLILLIPPEGKKERSNRSRKALDSSGKETSFSESMTSAPFDPEPRGPRVLPVGELVLWYRMFAPYGRLLGTTGFARGAP